MANMFALEPLGQTRTEADQTQDAQGESGALEIRDSNKEDTAHGKQNTPSLPFAPLPFAVSLLHKGFW